MPKQWTEGRFILTRLEVPTLRENTAERENTGLFAVTPSVNVFLIKYFDKSN